MIWQRAKWISMTLYALDMMATAAAFLVAFQIRNVVLPAIMPSIFLSGLYPLPSYLWMLGVFAPVLSIGLWLSGLYRASSTFTLFQNVRGLIPTVFVGSAITGTIMFAAQVYPSRSLFTSFVITSFVFLVAERAVVRYVTAQARNRGYSLRNIIVVGSGERARRIARVIEEHKYWGLRIAGFVTDDESSKLPGGYERLGAIKEIPRLIQERVVDEIIFVVPRKRLADLEEIFLICEEHGVRTRLALNFFPHMIAKMTLEDVSGTPFLTFSTTPDDQVSLSIKRGMDFLVSSMLVALASPIFLLTSVAIKATSRGPILFRQRRRGLNGRMFTLYKFRSMKEGAERERKDLEQFNEMEGPVFKMRRDPRVTRVGRFIRRTSIDELPQLFNVIKGDMSLVGPRPAVPEEVDSYEPWQRRRISMKPGVTCLWQISGRSRIDFDEWMRLDLQYIDNWSLWLDLKIFLKTIPVVLTGKGAR